MLKYKLNYLTTNKYLDMYRCCHRFLVIRPLKIVDKNSKIVKIIQPGEKICHLYTNYMKEFHDIKLFRTSCKNEFYDIQLFRLDSVLQNGHQNHPHSHEIYNNIYYINFHEICQNTIPYDMEFEIYLKYKGNVFEFKLQNPDYNLSEYNGKGILEIFGYLIGFFNFADDLMIKSFGRSIMDALNKFSFIVGNKPSWKILNDTIFEVKLMMKNLYDEAMKLEEETHFQDYNEYIKELETERIRIENERKELEKQDLEFRHKQNTEVLESLKNKGKFFSAFRKV